MAPNFPQSPPPNRHLVRWIVGASVLVAIAVMLWAARSIGNPFPPRSIEIATGPEGSAYHEYGLRYREILKRAGYEVRLVPTQGGVENLSLLRDANSGVSVAFVEGGLARPEDAEGLASLGTVSLSPLWFFSRGTAGGLPAQRLAGKRVSIGPEGSSTRVLANRLFALNGLEGHVRVVGLPPEETADSLIAGVIDGAVLLMPYQSPAVRRLLTTGGVVLEGYPRADAYVALSPTLSKLVLPMGVADLARNIPPADVTLLAVEGSLLVRRDLHPALQYTLLEAASEIHSGPDVFYRAGRFPSPAALDLPLSPHAREFYKSGLPVVYRYMPSWMAGVSERLLILAIPFFTIVFPVANFGPSLYAAFIQKRIFRLYGELKLIETEMEERGPGNVSDEVVAALADLSKRANRMKVPLGYAQRLFILKSHIAMAQDEVDKHRQSAAKVS